MNTYTKYLTRHEAREIIQKCLKYGLTLKEIRDTIKGHDNRKSEMINGRYGF